jgi:hypothetical protein
MGVADPTPGMTELLLLWLLAAALLLVLGVGAGGAVPG